MIERLETLPEFLLRMWFVWLLIGLAFVVLKVGDWLSEEDDVDALIRWEEKHDRL